MDIKGCTKLCFNTVSKKKWCIGLTTHLVHAWAETFDHTSHINGSTGTHFTHSHILFSLKVKKSYETVSLVLKKIIWGRLSLKPAHLDSVLGVLTLMSLIYQTGYRFIFKLFIDTVEGTDRSISNVEKGMYANKFIHLKLRQANQLRKGSVFHSIFFQCCITKKSINNY